MAGILCLTASLASAQDGTLRGIVVDSAGNPVRDADVSIPTLRELTKTNAEGRFAFRGIRTGEIELSVRRLGYEPKVQKLVISGFAVDSVRIMLTARAVELAGVTVTAAEQRRRQGIEGFHRRRAQGLGQYISREQVEARFTGNITDMLRTVPGLRFVKARGRSGGVRFPTTSLRGGDCMPMIWIDGQKAPGMEVDDITLTDVEGIEVYSGPSTTPMQFSQSSSQLTCGTIVIWSRPPPLAKPKR